ncbi:hypothetical protein RT41_GL000947 [Lactococcus fujiensis JCM 16395]|uniref:Uncharacterized protein n=1 Tax=Lactococcus fujiensis JCM 16395 TaxID=1291764 RepID=A0A2A5RI08_9LACT|nr:hypothetical protein RT41_GL000947 [Lactococcus fujiensis JCM 16395]
MNYLKKLRIMQLTSKIFFISIVISLVQILFLYNSEISYSNSDILIFKATNLVMFFFIIRYLYSFIKKLNILKKNYLLMNTKERDAEAKRQILYKGSLIYYKKIQRNFFMYIFFIIIMIVTFSLMIINGSPLKRYNDSFYINSIITGVIELPFLVYYLILDKK